MAGAGLKKRQGPAGLPNHGGRGLSDGGRREEEEKEVVRVVVMLMVMVVLRGNMYRVGADHPPKG